MSPEHKKFISEVKLKIQEFLLGNYNSIEVYHGSDNNFDDFDLSKIGSGDGRSLGGWGIYFSDSEEVSRIYISNSGKIKKYIIPSNNYFDLNESLDDSEAYRILSFLKKNNISDEDVEQFESDFIGYIPEITNRQVYEWLTHVLGSMKNASLFLDQLGYVGNKYTDRVHTHAHNYVIFNTSNIKKM